MDWKDEPKLTRWASIWPNVWCFIENQKEIMI